MKKLVAAIGIATAIAATYLAVKPGKAKADQTQYTYEFHAYNVSTTIYCTVDGQNAMGNYVQIYGDSEIRGMITGAEACAGHGEYAIGNITVYDNSFNPPKPIADVGVFMPSGCEAGDWDVIATGSQITASWYFPDGYCPCK